MKVCQRTENGTATQVSVKEGLAEINNAMLAGKREVRTMSSISSTDYAIEYTGGRKVTLVQVDAPAEATPTSQPTTNVIGVRGGKVHAKSAFDDGQVHAQCRVSARTQYRETPAAITCDVCAENVRRGGHGA